MNETKICRGISHPEGVELPIDNFRLACYIRTIKVSRHKGNYNCNKGELKLYYYSVKICKKCEVERSLKYMKLHPKQTISNRRKYQKGSSYRRSHNLLRKAWRLKYPEKERLLNKKYRHQLTDSYVRRTLIQIVKDSKCSDFSKESIKVKRELLLLYRETKNYYHGKNYRT